MRASVCAGGIASALLAFLWTAPAQADLVAFTYQGPSCSTEKCDFGMTSGDAVNATLYFNSSSLATKTILDTGDLVDFSITGGSFHMTRADATAFLQFNGGYNLNGALDGFPGFSGSSANKIIVGTLSAAQRQYPNIGKAAELGHNFWLVGNGSLDQGGLLFNSANGYAEGVTSGSLALFSRVNNPAPQRLISGGGLPPSQPILLPTNTLPPVTGLLASAQSFYDQYHSQLPPETDKYLQIALTQSTSLTVDMTALKQQAAAQAFTLQAIADALDVATALPSGSTSEKDLLIQALSTTSAANDALLSLSSQNTNLSSLTKISNAIGDFATDAASCVGKDGLKCAVSAFSYVVNHMIVPTWTNFAQSDPPDSDYQTAFVLPEAISVLDINSGDAAFDEAAGNTLYQLEASGLYLFATNISINRYSSALAANDPTSAVLQLETALHYLALYNSAIREAHADLAALLALPEFQIVLDQNYDSAAFVQLQRDLQAFGFSPDDLAYFSKLGFDQTQIDLLENAFLTYEPPQFDGTVGSMFSSLNDGLADVSRPEATPEPPSGLILLGALLFLIMVSRQARRVCRKLNDILAAWSNWNSGSAETFRHFTISTRKALSRSPSPSSNISRAITAPR